MRRKQQQSGWTLMELLLVMAILVVLSAIVYVLSAPLRRKANETRCISNLRQIGVALTLYRQDYDGVDLPEARTATEYGLPQYSLLVMMPYIKDENIFRCNEEHFPANVKPKISYQYTAAHSLDHPPHSMIPTFHERTIQRGDDMLLAIDPHHGQQFRDPEATAFHVLILRLNNQVEAKEVQKKVPTWKW